MRHTARWQRMFAVGALAGAALVAITAPPAAATTSVATESALRTAFSDSTETHIDLTADITLSSKCPDGAIIRTGTTPIVVDGHGHTVTQTCTTGVSSLFVNNDGGALTFENITITGGHSTANGGGILTQDGDVTLIDSTVTGNTSTSNGGGIAADVATLTLTNSTVSNNHAAAVKGSGAGGGILAKTVIATDSTISGNSAVSAGGGTFALDYTLVYTDVVGNTAPQGANLDIENSDTLISFASVITNPLGGGDNCFFGQGEHTVSHGYNWDDDGSCGFGAGPGDKSNAGSPGLGSLADNGGDTETLLPQTGSGLIDAIPNSACEADGASGIALDQRGSARPSPPGGKCDIGAVEVQQVHIDPIARPKPPPPVTVQPAFTG
jgi:predicted outer membrane repeat protein